MTDPPPKGQMYLFDSITPPLPDGSYRLTAETDVTISSASPSYQDQRYFNIVGPRFSVPQSMVAGCFPPNNATGGFDETLPHIVLSRRTLPWERKLDGSHLIPAPTTSQGDPPALDLDRTPWVALLLFEEGEYTLYRNIPLEQAVPPDVFQRLGSPHGITCDAVEASLFTLTAIMPSLEEIQLLAHGRWVNVDDRELNTAGGDGFYSVVVSNRLPEKGKRYRAVLVSLEERSDLVTADPPPTAEPYVPLPLHTTVEAAHAATLQQAGAVASTSVSATLGGGTASVAASGTSSENVTSASREVIPLPVAPAHMFTTVGTTYVGPVWELSARLVALTSWTFTCDKLGTFRELTQALDDRMFGSVVTPGQPALSDTGHLPLTLQDRMGAGEQVWYRGPLVPYNLTRDPLGPYHSADQARRVTPDTGAEDVSYAAAFEVGRLLAVADARLAQALIRWRRESYKQSARASVIAAIQTRVSLSLPPTLAQTLHTPVVPVVASATAQAVVQARPPIADAYGLGKVAAAPGLNPAQVAVAWNLSSTSEAAALLGADPGTLGPVVSTGSQSARPNTSIGAVAADTASLDRLSSARSQLVDDTITRLGGA